MAQSQTFLTELFSEYFNTGCKLRTEAFQLENLQSSYSEVYVMNIFLCSFAILD